MSVHMRRICTKLLYVSVLLQFLSSVSPCAETYSCGTKLIDRNGTLKQLCF